MTGDCGVTLHTTVVSSSIPLNFNENDNQIAIVNHMIPNPNWITVLQLNRLL